MIKPGALAGFILWLAAAAVLAIYLMMHLRVVSDIGQFMPTANKDPQLQALMSELQNGPAGTMLMVSISGADSATLGKLSIQLRQRLNADRELFLTVQNGHTIYDWHSAESLFPYRYLLSEKLDWTPSALHQVFEARLSDLRSGAGAMLGDIIPSDPQLAFIKYLHAIVDTTGPVKKHGVWFNKSEKNALLLLRVRSDQLDLDVMKHALDEIRVVYRSLPESSAAKLEIAGPGVMAVESRTAIQNVMTLMTQFMIVLLIVVSFLGYRSIHALWLTGLPLLSAILVALTVTQLIFNEVHSIVLVFGITLLGVCLDYPLHLFSHLRSGESPSTSINKIWPTLRLSGLSTVIAFLALLGSGFSGLSQLAIFAACGLIVALAMTRYVLPVWISPGMFRPRLWPVYAVPGFKKQMVLASLFIGIPLIVVVQSDHFWETSIEAISPVPAASRMQDKMLRDELNVPEVSHVFMETGRDLDQVLQASDEIYLKLVDLQKLGIIHGLWSPSQILPPLQRQHERQLSLPTHDKLTHDSSIALDGLPFRAESFSPWIKSVSESRNMKPVTYDTILATPLAQILRQELFRYGDQWVSMIRIGGVRSEQELNLWLDSHADVKASHIELKRATEHLLNVYRNATFERLILVMIILVAIVLVWSRSIIRSVWLFLPVIIGMLAGIAAPLLMGVSISVFHLLALLLVLGMGLDYSLFFNRPIGNDLEKQQQFHAISLSAFTTSAGFSVLAFSSVPVLSGIGQTVSVGIFSCFISSWLLASPQADTTPEEAIL